MIISVFVALCCYLLDFLWFLGYCTCCLGGGLVDACFGYWCRSLFIA